MKSGDKTIRTLDVLSLMAQQSIVGLCRAALKSRISPLRPIFWHLNRALLPWFSP